MAERRSSRAKKAIKYSAFEEHSDDDFADTTPPPPKKQRGQRSADKKDASKIKEGSVCQTVADVYEPDSNRKRRVPLSEKIYERELQQALEVSLLQSQGSQDSDTKKTKIDPPAAQVGHTKSTENSEAEAAAALKHVSGVIVEEKIELLAEKVENTSRAIRDRSRRCSETQGKQNVAPVKSKMRQESDDEDDDYASDEENDSDGSVGEEESDDDSDFGYSSKPPVRKKKTPVKNKAQTAVKSNKKDSASKVKLLAASSTTEPSVSHVPAKTPGPPSLPKAPISSTKKSNCAPSRSPAAPSSLTSSWKPPAFSSPGSSSLSTVKSPTSGLRLGLSRNQRVKSLHPSVHVT